VPLGGEQHDPGLLRERPYARVIHRVGAFLGDLDASWMSRVVMFLDTEALIPSEIVQRIPP